MQKVIVALKEENIILKDDLHQYDAKKRLEISRIERQNDAEKYKLLENTEENIKKILRSIDENPELTQVYLWVLKKTNPKFRQRVPLWDMEWVHDSTPLTDILKYLNVKNMNDMLNLQLRDIEKIVRNEKKLKKSQLEFLHSLYTIIHFHQIGGEHKWIE